jgi:hypothetical protein
MQAEMPDSRRLGLDGAPQRDDSSIGRRGEDRPTPPFPPPQIHVDTGFAMMVGDALADHVADYLKLTAELW